MRLAVILTVCGLVASPSSGGAEQLARFGWFADLVDACWVGDFPNGKTRHSQCYTTQFDRFIRGAAELSGDHNGQQVQQFAGDSVFAWDEKTNRMIYYIWGSDGSHSRHEAYYEGEQLVFPAPGKKDPQVVAYRSVWRRLDPTTFEVRRERPDGADWKTDLTVVYRKTAAPR
jgi:hypothetical protein